MSVDMGTAVAYLTLDTKNYNSGIQSAGLQMKNFMDSTREIDDRLVNLGGAFGTVGKTLSVGLTVPLMGAGVAMFKLASDVDESINKIDVAFGDSSENVKSWAQNTLENIGLAKGSAMDMAANFGDMATSMDIPQQKAAEMSKTLVNLSGDLASFKNISIEQSKTALNAVFTGETESLKMLGIVMTEVNLNAFAMSQGIDKTVQSMTEAEKVQLRYDYVLAKTKNSQGDFARTVDGAANQMRIFTEGLKELGANLGENLLPVFTPIIANVNGLVKSFGALNPDTQKFIVNTGLMVAAMGPAALIFGKLSTGVGGIINSTKLFSDNLRMIGTTQAEANQRTLLLNSALQAEAKATLAVAQAQEQQIASVSTSNALKQAEQGQSVKISQALQVEAAAYTNLIKAQNARTLSSTNETRAAEKSAQIAYNNATARKQEALATSNVVTAETKHALSLKALEAAKAAQTKATLEATIAENTFNAVQTYGVGINDTYTADYYAMTEAKKAQALATQQVVIAEVEASAATAALAGAEIKAGVASAAASAGQLGFAATLETVTAGLIAQAAAWAMTPMGMAAIAIGSVIAIAGAADYLSKAYERQKERLADLTGEYDKSKSDLDALSEKFKTSADRINALKTQGPLTVVEQQELVKLENSNQMLLTQLETKKQLFAMTQKTLQLEATKTIDMAQDKTAKEIENYKNLQAELVKLNAESLKSKDIYGTISAGINQTGISLDRTREKLAQYAVDLADNNALIDISTEAGKKQLAANNALIDSIAEIVNPMGSVVAETDKLTVATDEAAEATETLAEKQAKAAEELKKIGDSYKDAIKNAETLKETQVELTDAGKLDTSSLDEIISLYPEAIAYANDFGAMQDFVSSKIAEQEGLALNNYRSIISANETAINAIMGKSAQLPNVLASYYGVDYANFTETAKQKYLTESNVVKDLSALWAKYANTSQKSIETQMLQLEKFSMKGTITDESKKLYNELALVSDVFAKMETDYKKLDLTVAKPLGGTSGGATKSIKETNDALKEQLALLEHKKKVGEVDAGEEISQLEKIKTAYTKTQAEKESIDEKLYVLRQELNKKQEELQKKTTETELKAFEETKKRIDALSKGLQDATTDTIANIDRVMAQQKELDGLADSNGVVFSFTSGNEIELINQKIKANNDFIASINALADEQGRYSEEQLKQLKTAEKANANYYDNITTIQIKAKKEFQAATKELDTLNATFAKNLATSNEKYAESVSSVNKKLKDELLKAEEDYLTKTESINKKLADDEKTLTVNYENELRQRADSMVNFTDIFAEVTRKDISGQQLLQNLNDQLDMMKEYQKQMTELQAKGVDKELLNVFEGKGVSAADELKALNSLTAEELAQYEAVYKEKNAIAKVEAEKQMQGQKTLMQQQLQMLRQETVVELSALDTEYQARIAELTTNAAVEIAKHTFDWKTANEEITLKHDEETAKIELRISQSVVTRGEQYKKEQVLQNEQEKQKTTNTTTELKKQEREVLNSSNTNVNTLKTFVPQWLSVGQEYGNALLQGIQGTKDQIQSYLASVAAAYRAAQSGGEESISGYALGTQSAARGLALVGENGPEIVDFSGGEQVLTFQRSMALVNDAVNTASASLNVVLNTDMQAFQVVNMQTPIDYDKLGSVLAEKLKPSINYSPTYNSPVEASILELQNQDRRNLQRLGLGVSL